MKIKVSVGLDGFGDAIMAATFTQILIDNGIDAQFAYPDDIKQEIFTVPTWTTQRETEQEYSFSYKMKYAGDSLYHQNLKRFQEETGKTIFITTNKAPVKVEEYTGTPVDVVLCCTSGYYSMYRDWPYSEKLRMKLAKHRITFKDVAGMELTPKVLGFVEKCKLVVTVETGLAHYVSNYPEKVLVLASGHAHPDFWSIYGYNYLDVTVSCKNCFLAGSNLKRCYNNHSCMNQLDVKQVLKEIIKSLAKPNL